MKIRSGHVTVFIIVLLGALTLLVLYVHRPVGETETEEDFLRGVRSLQRDAPDAEGVGQLPPVDADESLIASIEPETTNVEIGPVSNKRKTTTEIKIHNRGKATLHIADVRSSCVCVTARMDRLDIPPGSHGVMAITVDPFKIYRFDAHKVLTIFSNDPHRGTAKIDVYITVEPEFALEPMNIDFGVVEQGARPEKTMLLRQLTDEPIGLEAVEALGEPPLAEFEFQRRPKEEWNNSDKPEYIIRARLSPRLIPGDHEQFFKVDLDCRRIPYMRCSVKARVEAFYKVQPKLLVVAAGLDKKYATAEISAPEPFEIVDVQTRGPGLAVEVAPDDNRRNYKIVARIAPGKGPEDVLRSILFTVKRDGEKYVNRLPVRTTLN